MHLPRTTILAIGLCAFANTASFAADAPETLKLSLHPEDGHSLSVEGESATIDIRSPRGIGRTTVRSADGNWPKRLILRLHLKGLEHFEISNGLQALATSVSSTKGAAPRPTHVTPGAGAARPEIENQVTADHPLALHIRPVPAEGEKPKIPLIGYFEVEAPADLLKAKPRELHIRWIDFYR